MKKQARADDHPFLAVARQNREEEKETPAPTIHAAPKPDTPPQTALPARQPQEPPAAPTPTPHPTPTPTAPPIVRDITFVWPTTDTHTIRDTHTRAARTYRDHHKTVHPGVRHQLTLSKFTAHALQRALNHTDDWASRDTIRNDGRKQPIHGGTTQQGMSWPADLIDRLNDAAGEWTIKLRAEDYAVTLANFAVAAILTELAHVNEWLFEVPNDDRLTEPRPDDKRLTGNKPPRD